VSKYTEQLQNAAWIGHDERLLWLAINMEISGFKVLQLQHNECRICLFYDTVSAYLFRKSADVQLETFVNISLLHMYVKVVSGLMLKWWQVMSYTVLNPLADGFRVMVYSTNFSCKELCFLQESLLPTVTINLNLSLWNLLVMKATGLIQ
jgi:hypothetical protein